MKHRFAEDVKIQHEHNIDIELNNTGQELESLVRTVADQAAKVVVIYMVGDTLRHILKKRLG